MLHRVARCLLSEHVREARKIEAHAMQLNNLIKEHTMKRILTHAALAAVLALGALTPGVMAKTRRKTPSAEHVAAIKKCNEDYSAAVKADKTKKGKERREADAAARKAKRDCIASAPK
jgi:uncharacterized low-complexity protein